MHDILPGCFMMGNLTLEPGHNFESAWYNTQNMMKVKGANKLHRFHHFVRLLTTSLSISLQDR